MASGLRHWCRQFLAIALGVMCTVVTVAASALPATVSITSIEIDDPDHDVDPGATTARYLVSNVIFDGVFMPVGGIPQVGVCSLAQPPDNASGCKDRIVPPAGAWSFTRDVDPALGTVDVLIQVRHSDAARINPLDITPTPASPSEWGLAVTIDLQNGSWVVRNDPRMSPTDASSSFIGSHEAARLTGRVTFAVSLCGGGAACPNGGSMACAGSACTTGPGSTPGCSNLPGTLSCGGGVASCVAAVSTLPDDTCDHIDNNCNGVVDEGFVGSPEVINGKDDDCDGQTDEGLSPLTCAPGQTDWWCCPTGEVRFPVDQVTAVNGPSIDNASEDDAAAACLPVGFGSGTGCNLRGAVRRAEQLRQIDGVRPGCAVVAELAPGRHELAREALGGIFADGTDYGASFLAIAAGNLTLRGMGPTPASTVIEPRGSQHRLLRIVTPEGQRPPQVTVQNVTMRGGFANETLQRGGGAILIRRTGPASAAQGLLKLTVEDSIFERNRASQEGGAIQLWDDPSQQARLEQSSVLTIRRTLFRHNAAGGFANALGGAVSVAATTLILEESAIVNNFGTRGGGVHASDAAFTAVNNTFSGNNCNFDGCGLYIRSDNSPAPDVVLRFNTITENRLSPLQGSGGSGPGLAVDGAVNLMAFGNIIADNSGPLTGQSTDCAIQVPLLMSGVMVGHNLVGVGGLDCAQLGDPADLLIGTALEPVMPQLEDLPNTPRPGSIFANVCPAGVEVTPDCDVACLPAANAAACVHALRTTPLLSPAADAYPSGATGDAADACPHNDQRRWLRPVAENCSLGAFELRAASDDDFDGIPNDLDPQPLLFSNAFSDENAFGVTSGSILDRGDQRLIFDDATGLEDGIFVRAMSDGGSVPAQISLCGGALIIALSPGDVELITCPRPHACIYAQEGLLLRDRAKAFSDISGGSFSLGFNASVSGSASSHGNAQASTGASISGNATLAGSFSGFRQAVKGTLFEYASVSPESIPVRVGASTETSSLIVPSGSSLALDPGMYGDVTVRTSAALHLGQSGLYRFRSLRFESDTRLWIEDGSHQTVLAVDGTLSFGDRFIMSGELDPELVLFYSGGSSIEVGFDARVVGSIESPVGQIELLDRVHLRGCTAGQTVTVGFDTVVGENAALCNPESVVQNGGFEAGTQPFTPRGGTLSDTTTRARSGTHSGRVTGRTATSHGPSQSLLGAVSAGASYRVRAFAQPSSSSSQNLDLVMRYRCNAGAEQTQRLARVSGTSSSWQELSGLFVVPSCHLTALAVSIEGPSSGTTLYVDDVSMLQQCL